MFICTKCGLCCRNIDKIPELKSFDAGDGRCIHLTKDNLCEIYPSRPDICNVEKMYEIKFHNIMSWQEYIEGNEEGCRLLQNAKDKVDQLNNSPATE